ncbi:MAG: nucleotide exchange factor GrpE [Gaiellaceae bacterium]
MTGGDVTEHELKERVDELDASLAAHLEKIVAVEAERDEYLGDLKRVAAEFENFRKRAARERDAIVQRANGRLIGECLDILDDLERALAAGGETNSSTLMEGVALVERRLRALLEKEGVTEIDTEGTFDPHVHEALLTQPSEVAEGTILGVMQKGYAIGDVVLRPARVAVAGPQAAAEVPEADRSAPPGDGETAS